MLDVLEGFVALLKSHGAWALVTILGFVIWRLALYIGSIQTKHQETIQKLLLDHNAQQRDETKQLVAAMLSTEKALQAMNQTLTIMSTRGS